MKARTWIFSAAAAVALAAPGAALACPEGGAMAGVVQRIDGPLDDVTIQRSGAGSVQPAPMQILCEGDVLASRAATTAVTYRLEGSPSSAVLRGPSQVQFPRGKRGGTVVDNALQILIDNWMPELHRSASFGTSRGPEPDSPTALWAISGIDNGAAVLGRSYRPLYIRWIGGMGPFEAQLLSRDERILARVPTSLHQARFAARQWNKGVYILRIYSGVGTNNKQLALSGSFHVGDGPAAARALPASVGEELQTASAALSLASSDPDRWSLEAVQMIDNAPQQGLDRKAIYVSFAKRGN